MPHCTICPSARRPGARFRRVKATISPNLGVDLSKMWNFRRVRPSPVELKYKRHTTYGLWHLHVCGSGNLTRSVCALLEAVRDIASSITAVRR
jgi:hypothetical protein